MPPRLLLLALPIVTAAIVFWFGRAGRMRSAPAWMAGALLGGTALVSALIAQVLLQAYPVSGGLREKTAWARSGRWSSGSISARPGPPASANRCRDVPSIASNWTASGRMARCVPCATAQPRSTKGNERDESQ